MFFYDLHSDQGSIWGGWPRVGSLIDFRKSEVGHLSKGPKMAFLCVLGYFWRKIFLRRLRRRKNVNIRPNFPKNRSFFKIFGTAFHLSIYVTPRLVGHPQIKPWFGSGLFLLLSDPFLTFRRKSQGEGGWLDQNFLGGWGGGLTMAKAPF